MSIATYFGVCTILGLIALTIYATRETKVDAEELYMDWLKELREYWLTQDEDEGGHGQMTFREKLKQEHPDRVGDSEYVGGCIGCPTGYGAKIPDYCKKGTEEECRACWDREIPGDNKPVDDFARFGPHSKNPYGKDDPVNHPSHYTAGGIECIDAIAAALACQKDPMEAWLTGQVLKYLWRWPLKNGKEDLEKAQFYLNRLIEKVGGK